MSDESEIERLRGIIDGARFFINEDMIGCAAIILCGTGLDGGIDPTLRDTPCGRIAIKEGLDRRDVEEAARHVATCSESEMPEALARLRAAFAALGEESAKGACNENQETDR